MIVIEVILSITKSGVFGMPYRPKETNVVRFHKLISEPIGNLSTPLLIYQRLNNSRFNEMCNSLRCCGAIRNEYGGYAW